ncbi:MAG TPA: molybdopterin cofactor-binding domain-containing protein, partial [Trebonia sp.]|nr:molybdopterin cofactor-binding domain-containing protein [Trebonia sp.]
MTANHAGEMVSHAVPHTAAGAIAAGHRTEGAEKVTGAARYASEHPVPDPLYAFPVLAPVASGRIGAVDTAGALAMPGVVTVLWGDNTNSFGAKNFELGLFSRSEVTYRGQLVGAVIADTLENARAAAAAVRISYEPGEHDVLLRADHPGLYKPEKINPALPADTEYGDVAAGLAGPVLTGTGARVDVTYTTPVQHNNPMEPHAAIATWDDRAAEHGVRLTVYDSTQGPSADRDTIAAVLGLLPEQVRVISPHVGGGFGAKGTTRPHAILAAIAARAVGRPVKVALTRQQMFTLTGHRTPTIQRLRLAATADGRLTAVAHDVVEHTATRTEFAEQTAACTRVMYRTPALRTTHRLARLNVPAPSWMRAPGETPGMYALESAMDELAVALGMDPVELRVVNDPTV